MVNVVLCDVLCLFVCAVLMCFCVFGCDVLCAVVGLAFFVCLQFSLVSVCCGHVSVLCVCCVCVCFVMCVCFVCG